ncbi:aspartate dehydrogenase domain-containing protein [Nocardioides sp. YIM 152588]|uniref:aspartate dehydrogenase domain-containing protein n=1 Tax=Nocardioides sp. YIM 152588 TaxID=3158259 RepID=UPI0032E3CE48
MAGTGAIGTAVASALAAGGVDGATLVATLDSRSTPAEVAAALDLADVLVEATTVEAAGCVVPAAVAAGVDVLVCSCGVLADPAVVDRLAAGPGRVLLPAGALGGFDVLTAATRAGADHATVRHTTVKRPAALGVTEPIGEPREVFRGSAREAARAFPRTSNSSVALAFATVGLDRVEVVVVADPTAEQTRHVVTFDSPVGRYELSFVNAVDDASGGRTSRITAWSVLETLAALAVGVGPGAVVLG